MEIELAKPLVARILGKNTWKNVRNADINTECSTYGFIRQKERCSRKPLAANSGSSNWKTEFSSKLCG